MSYAVVIPTVGRPELAGLLTGLDTTPGPAPDEVVVVDDRPAGEPLELPETGFPLRLLRSGGRGPAAARNTGWRATGADWVVFLDDDVCTGPDWRRRLAADLRELPARVAGSQGRIVVPLPDGRRPADDERGTAGLAGARWITADMAYRREALEAVGGFDERFPRAYREDADIALRILDAGYALERGDRVTVHPARRAGFLASLRAQRGNADNALLRRLYGRGWRRLIGEGPGRLGRHALATAAAVTAVAALPWSRKVAAVAAGLWTGLTAEFAVRRIAPGPRTPDEIARMLLTSVLIPPAACYHRLRGEIAARGHRRPPKAVLFDRDDTLITDRPYLADADGVDPVPGAAEILRRLRESGVRVGVVSNQSGVARGLISPAQLADVNARVEQLLGPFDTWQVCVHGADDGCRCRKPRPGMVRAAARELGISPRDCVVIGDTGADVAAALAAGAGAVLVPTVRTLPAEVDWARRAAAVAGDLATAVRLATGVRR
ncbi:HAD-IIIA family hydrolase [Amycolatopsis suaedae]|uniref:D,D-heptose 1,7-bisphosphate phosphatase n=1 Tax=Amycolatopsis suaedae TaxID=2510978 RepID=A0A4Q7J1B3_9PSEU|nr:HAD-IIIA family hydrolase [Amycolatopsis suaedae]RZQ60226.1 HAD-IIIA family hydrolase [Amycolatopsis suaedae]